MLYATAKYKDSFASGYIHQIAWANSGRNENIIFARIAGKQTLVKAMAGNLYRGNYIRMNMPDNTTKYLYGAEKAKCTLFKIDKIGVATYYSTDIFNPNSNISYIIGRTEEDIDKAFRAILRNKPVCCHEAWEIKTIMKDMELINKIDSYGISAYEVIWDEERINQRICELVKDGKLTF